MTALATSNVSSKNDVSIVTLPLHTYDNTTQRTARQMNEKQRRQLVEAWRSGAADVGEGQGAERLEAAPAPLQPPTVCKTTNSMRRHASKGRATNEGGAWVT